MIVFASGAATGFIVGRSQAPPSGDLPTRSDVLDAFEREVGLDADQKATFKKIFDTNHPRFREIKLRSESELAPIRSEVRAQLRAVLREDQKPRFDSYCNKRDRQRDESMR